MIEYDFFINIFTYEHYDTKELNIFILVGMFNNFKIFQLNLHV